VSQEKKIVEDISSLLVNGISQAHDIDVSEDSILKVWVKELSFLDMQGALREVVHMQPDGDVEIDISGYWKYMMNTCIEKTEPALTTAQLYSLKPDVANQIIALLPQPAELMGGPLADGLTE
tara:strand:+ start:53 stop:418 length:366 start_codon:yes stop_codon:yes gene_type:complete